VLRKTISLEYDAFLVVFVRTEEGPVYRYTM
jgi:hypothetical protein